MTRKDFELIASALLEARNITKEQGVIDWISNAIADRIQAEHPRFDSYRFSVATGVIQQVKYEGRTYIYSGDNRTFS